MRRLNLQALSSVSIATLAAVAFPAAASAQTEQQQVEAQRINNADAQEAERCRRLESEEARAACLRDAPRGEQQLPQSGAPAGEEVVVTGSRIARPNFDSPTPAVVIDSAQIESRGFETLGQAINEQPAFGVPGASPVGAAQGGSFGSGQSFVNFLGLGDQRTLTLVNGRRFVTSNSASIFGPSSAGSQVDLSAINTRLVERIETIAIGGAPIYGSDAIAGTVNVILRRDFEGIEIDAQYGIGEPGDAANYRVRGIAGMNFGGGRGNVVISGEYNRGEGLVYNDRPTTRANRFYSVCNPGSQFSQCLFNDRRIPSISEFGIPFVSGGILGFPLSPEQNNSVDFFSGFFASNGLPGDIDGDGRPGTLSDIYVLFGGFPGQQDTITDAQGRSLRFDANGNLIPIQFGSPVGARGDFEIDFSGGNGFNLTDTSNLLTDTERYNANILLSYQLTDGIRFFMEGWYSYASATNLRDQPVYNSALFDPTAGSTDGNIILSTNNPFLSPQARALINASIAANPFATPGQFELGRANIDLRSGRAFNETEIYRVVGGLDGRFSLGGRDLSWELVGNYGRSDNRGREPALVQQNFENAINAVTNASGQIVCAPGAVNAPIQTVSSTCAPLNLFGNQASQAAVDYITAIAEPTSRSRQWVVTASVSGPLFSLPGGNLSFALGAEHRDERTNFDPGVFFAGGDDPDPATDSDGNGNPADDRVQFGRFVPILPVEGGFNTDEIFGELTAEILSPSNNVPFLNRLEVHGAARYVDHSVAGGDWTYTIEGRWSPVRDITFRANFTHAIRAPAITENFNPSSTFFGFATDPCDVSQRQNGPNPATRQANCTAAGIPANFQALSDSASFLQATQGNPNLDNERSNAFSVGVVLTPRFIPNLRISADYLDIRLANAISSFSGSQVAASCYDDSNFPNNAFCARLQRGADNQLTFLETSYFNASELRYKGILAALDYRIDTPFFGANSRIAFNASYQYLDTLTSQSTTSSTPTQTHGTIGYPRHSANLNINYENGGLLLFTSLNYTGEVVQQAQVSPTFLEFNNLDDVLFVNSGFAYNVNDRFRFRFSVDNVFNTEPPFPVPAFGGAVSYYPGVLGRYYRVGAAVRF